MITTLHDPEVIEVGGVLEHRTRVTFAPGTIEPGQVVQRVTPGTAAVADPSVLPLVPAAVVLACRLSQDLRVDEPLPPAIHAGARHVAALLHAWYGWRPAELIAPLAAETARPDWAHRRRGRGLMFTRGVDSWGTLLELLDGPRRNRPTHLITVDNEVHLPRALRRSHISQTQAVADELGLPLITVETDIRSLIDPHTDWGTDIHGSVFAGIGLLLRGSLSTVVISPTHWTPLVRPWGSHPELEPHWSVPGMAITHHPGDEPRWKRIERIVQQPLAARSLQVCWQGTSDRNCGRCEKCLRLMTSLELLGATDATAARFDVPFDPARITPEVVVSPHPWCDTIDHIDHVGLRADPLRQRWEQVAIVGRPKLWFQTRPVQPRIVVQVPDPEPPGAVAALDRRLAAIGVRRDLLGDRSPDTAIALADLEGRDLVAVLTERGVDLSGAVRFEPDGQEPPPLTSAPPGWYP